MLLFVFYHDVDLELSWMAEHVPASGSTAHEKSLAGALSLMQKHKVPTGSDHPPPPSQGMTDLFHLPQELQAEVTAHKTHLNLILEKVRSLAQTSKSQAEEVLQR